MKFFERARGWAEANTDIALDLIRVYLGLGLILKAVSFMSGREQLMSLIEDSSTLWFAPAAIAHYVILAHLVGGFLLMIGFFTRPAALIQIPILLGALFWVHMPRMITLGMHEDVQFAALTLFLLLVIFLYGAGRFSLDHYFSRQPAEAQMPVEKAA